MVQAKRLLLGRLLAVWHGDTLLADDTHVGVESCQPFPYGAVRVPRVAGVWACLGVSAALALLDGVGVADGPLYLVVVVLTGSRVHVLTCPRYAEAPHGGGVAKGAGLFGFQSYTLCGGYGLWSSACRARPMLHELGQLLHEVHGYAAFVKACRIG